MKAPSPQCLRTLRHLTYSFNNHASIITSRRCYATLPDKAPLPVQSKTPPPPSAIQRPPSRPGHQLRRKRDDDEEFIPRPLARPIGMPNPPQPGENMGIDKRSFQQRRDDFVDYDKHLVRRATMTKQISKPYFRDWSNMRFHKGKVFVANARLFRVEHALFFPNFYGRPLRKGLVKTRLKKDGYGGMGRDTCEVMKGKVSVVSFVTNAWAVDQAETFCSAEQNPTLHAMLDESSDVAQRVEINYEDNVLKWWVLRLFSLGGLRRKRSLEQQGRYFIVRRGMTEIIKEAIGLLNDKGGYVYLVDQECKIRWAGSAVAEEGEKESMVRGLRKLIQEARAARAESVEKPRLEEAVAEVVEVADKRAAAAGG